MSATFIGLVKERLVTFGYSGERTAFILLQGMQYLVPPVEGRLLVDMQGGGNLVKRLLFGHQAHVCLHEPFLVKLLLPRAGIFGESPAAVLAFEALRSVVLAETVVTGAAAMRAATLLSNKADRRELSGTVASHCLFGLNACTKDCRSVSDKDCAADNISLYVMILSF